MDRERGHAPEQARDEAGELALLLQACAAVMSGQDLKTVLGMVAERMLHLAGAEICAFLGWDEAANVLNPLLDCRADEGPVWQADRPGPVDRLGRFPLVDRVLRERIPAVVHTDEPSPENAAARAFLENLGMQSMLVLPVIAYDRVVGLAALMAGRHRHEFDQREVELAQVMAGQAGIAIKNDRLFQESERRITELAILNEIGQALSAALELDQLVEMVHQQVSRVFDTTNFYIASYEEGMEEWGILLEIDHGQRIPPQRYKLGSGMTGYILRHRRPVLLRSEQESIAFDREQGQEPLGEHCRSWMGVPLIAADKLVGVMAIQSYQEEGLYGEDDLALFSTIAAQAAIAIENARLFAQAQEQTLQLSALYETALELSSELSLERLMEVLIQRTLHLLGRDAGSLWLYGREDGLLHCVSSQAPWRDYTGMTLRPGEGLNGQVFVSGEPIVIDDYASWSGAAIAGEPFGPTVSVPLKWKGQVHGVLNLVDRPGAPVFDETEVQITMMLASQAAIAIENAELYARMQQQVWELSTPLMPVHDQVLVLPLVGVVDAERTRRFTERLLLAVQGQRARVVLLDITGVPVVDHAVAQALLQAAEATRLLGAEVVLVGVRAEVAQTLVALGMDMEGLVTRSNLQAGIEYALGRLGREIVDKEEDAPPAGRPASTLSLLRLRRDSS